MCTVYRIDGFNFDSAKTNHQLLIPCQINFPAIWCIVTYMLTGVLKRFQAKYDASITGKL